MNGKRGVPPMADPDQFTSINPTLHHSITPSLPRSLRLVTFSSYEKSSRPPLRRDEIDTLDVEIRAGAHFQGCREFQRQAPDDHLLRQQPSNHDREGCDEVHRTRMFPIIILGRSLRKKSSTQNESNMPKMCIHFVYVFPSFI